MGNKNRKHLYMIVDTETATLPFANEIARNEEEKKRIAIAKPLIYDIGWTMVNRKGEIQKTRQFLIAEIFSVPQVFNTAYYREKRPYYLDLIERDEIQVMPWKQVMRTFIKDANEATHLAAYNAMFDFKKAIPFTELYISKVYSGEYQEWEARQRNVCKAIARKETQRNEREFDRLHFTFREETYDILDLWGLACERLINNSAYKKTALLNGMVSPSGIFFKTSAEATYRFMSDQWEFAEAHTALQDALLETQILMRIISKKGKSLTPGIIYFPFRELGKTIEFLTSTRGLPLECYLPTYNAIQTYLMNVERASGFSTHLTSEFIRLQQHMLGKFSGSHYMQMYDLMADIMMQ